MDDPNRENELIVHPKLSIWERILKRAGPDWHSKLTAAATFVLMLATIIYTAFAGFQWHEMHTGGADTRQLAIQAKAQAQAAEETAKSMKDMAARTLAQAEATNRLATEAKRSADAATKSLAAADKNAKSNAEIAKTAEDSLKTSKAELNIGQRAWVGIVGLAISKVESGKPIECEVDYSNSGRTPALHIVLYMTNEVQDPQLPLSFLSDWNLINNGQRKQPIAPNAMQSFKQPGATYGDMLQEYLSKHRKVMLCHGVIKYDDVFGAGHSTEFCGDSSNIQQAGDIRPGWALNFCSAHNDMN